MARNKLTDSKCRAAKAGEKLGDGDGLWLYCGKTGGKSWVFIWIRQGKRREMGLGAYGSGTGAVSLALAREKAEAVRSIIARGGDPFAELAERALTKRVITFGEFADELVATMKPSFRNAKHAGQWETSVGKVDYDTSKIRIDRKAHAAHVAALRVLRDKPIDEVQTADVLALLTPIWHEAPETAGRVRGRVEKVLDAAKAKGLRTGENPAVWRGHLDNLLPKRQKLLRGHHAAMPFDEVPAFVARIREKDGVSFRALEFVILTAARTGEMRGATWREVDLVSKAWTIPGPRMKAGREHRVPLTPRMIEILEEMAKAGSEPDAFVFPGGRKGKGLSVMALDMALRRLDVDVTVHGFRSSFRDWCGECTPFPREVAEAALAHAVGDQTEQAYRRGDALEKRRQLMVQWENFIASPPNKSRVA